MHLNINPFHLRHTPAQDIGLLILMCLVIFGAGIGLKDPWPADEPRFALIAKEMVESGQWFFPTRAGELYPDKPPLFMWLIAIFYFLTGSIRFAHLIPSILAGLGTVLLVYDIGARMWCRRIGIYAAVTLVATLQFTLQARTAQIDATLCFWTTLALYGLLRHLVLGPHWGWYAAAGFSMGLGVITKGVGILPWLIFLPYAAGAWRSMNQLVRPGWYNWRWLTAIVTMLFAICLWLVPMLLVVALSQKPEYIAYRDNILFHQTADRYASSWTHVQPFYFFITNVIPLEWFPVSFALPWLIPAWWRRIRRGDGRFLLLLGWTVAIVLFFSASPGKRDVYLLPATPALALVAAPLVPGLVRRTGIKLVYLISTLAIVCVLLGLGISEWVRPWMLQRLKVDEAVTLWPLLMVPGVIGLIIALVTRLHGAVVGVLIFSVCLWLFFGWYGYPLVNTMRSTAPLMREVGEYIGPDAELAIIEWREQYFLFADRKMTHFGYDTPLPQERVLAAKWLQKGRDRWLLLPLFTMDSCFDKQRAHFVKRRHRDKWYLVNASMILPGCIDRTNGIKE